MKPMMNGVTEPTKPCIAEARSQRDEPTPGLKRVKADASDAIQGWRTPMECTQRMPMPIVIAGAGDLTSEKRGHTEEVTTRI